MIKEHLFGLLHIQYHFQEWWVCFWLHKPFTEKVILTGGLGRWFSLLHLASQDRFSIMIGR